MTNARRYSLMLIAGAVALFSSTVLANLVIDPEEVFGTKLFPPTPDRNERLEKLRLYDRGGHRADGLLFASSRGNLLDQATLAKRMGVRSLFSLAVSYGMITDHLPMLDYILRDKAARGERIEAVLLLLDADFFGKPPWTQSNINSFLPPKLSDEPAARYWWRYLTAFQFRLWRDVVRQTANRALAAPRAETPMPTTVGQAGEPPPALMPKLTSYRRSWNSTRPDLERQLEMLGRFAALCRQHGVRLNVAVSPVIAENLALHEPGVIEGIVARMTTVVPLWDFTASDVSQRRDYWADFSHFNGRAADMMIARVYGGDEVVPGFGRFRPAR